MRKNKVINRGVIPLSAEPNEIEWACSVRQRVGMWMKWVMDCFREDEKWQRPFKGKSKRDKAIDNFSGSEKQWLDRIMLKNSFELSLHYSFNTFMSKQEQVASQKTAGVLVRTPSSYGKYGTVSCQRSVPWEFSPLTTLPAAFADEELRFQ